MKQSFSSHFGRQLRVLVVDDHDDTLTMLETLLGSLGCDVTVAESSAVALERFATPPLPDLILSDLHMPDMDGYEFIRAVRACSDGHVAAIAVTGVTHSEDVQEAIDAGFDDCVAKPLSVELLADTVVRVLQTRKSGAEHA